MEKLTEIGQEKSLKKDWILPEMIEISVDGGTTVILSETFAGNKS
ncbi:MAG: hypothetical protein ACK4LB_12665 [Spirosomataceae bacterium]